MKASTLPILSEDSFISSDGKSEIYSCTFGSKNPKFHFYLTHGAIEHHRRHKELIQFLLQNFNQDIAVSTWDLVGHGLSGGVRAHVDEFDIYVNDFLKFLEKSSFINSERTKNFLLAHSLGGLINLTSVLDTKFKLPIPIKGMILSSPCIKPVMVLGKSSGTILEKVNIFSNKIHLPIVYHGKDLTRDQLRANDFDSDSLIPKFITTGMAQAIVSASSRIIGMSYYLNIPSLFLIAEDDKIVDELSTTLFAQSADKKLTTIKKYPQHYHELWNEIDRNEIFETMKDWINKLLKDTP